MMHSERPPIRRSSSMEMTRVIPRDQLPPPSTHNLDAMDLDPDHPETQALYERARDAEMRSRPTMIPCPEGCKPCGCCLGLGITTTERAEEWQAEKAKSAATDAKADESP